MYQTNKRYRCVAINPPLYAPLYAPNRGWLVEFVVAIGIISVGLAWGGGCRLSGLSLVFLGRTHSRTIAVFFTHVHVFTFISTLAPIHILDLGLASILILIPIFADTITPISIVVDTITPILVFTSTITLILIFTCIITLIAFTITLVSSITLVFITLAITLAITLIVLILFALGRLRLVLNSVKKSYGALAQLESLIIVLIY